MGEGTSSMKCQKENRVLTGGQGEKSPPSSAPEQKSKLAGRQELPDSSVLPANRTKKSISNLQESFSQEKGNGETTLTVFHCGRFRSCLVAAAALLGLKGRSAEAC